MESIKIDNLTFTCLFFYVISYITWEMANIDGMQRTTLTLTLLMVLSHVYKYLSSMLQRNTCWILLTCKMRRPQTSHCIKESMWAELYQSFRQSCSYSPQALHLHRAPWPCFLFSYIFPALTWHFYNLV